MVVRKIIFSIYRIYYKLFVKDIGNDCMLHGGGRAIGGTHIHMKNDIELSKGWLMAVYPSFGGKLNPVLASDHGIYLGNHVTANRELTIYCADNITIEDNVMIGSHVLITDNDHGTNPENGPYWTQPLNTKPVIIHEGCWICERAMILKGSEIGENSIVAANSVVKGKFPAYSMIAGAPARVVRTWDYGSHAWIKTDIN